MPDTPTKLQRWLDLVAYLAARRFPAPVDDIWRNVPSYAPGMEGGRREHETVRRMFERDKDELRALGIPIETVTYSIGGGVAEETGYRLERRDFYLPYLRLITEAGGEESAAARHFDLTHDEASAALSGLREVASLPAFPLVREARSAFRKLAFDLSAELLDDAPLLHAEDPETAAAADTMRALSDALLARKRVDFTYRSMTRDATGRRSARPYGLVFQHGRWYLVGHDEDRDDVRMFRVGRIEDVRANPARPGTPDFEVPEGFRLEDYAGRSAWELGEDPEGSVDARVRFAFPRSLWAERNGHGRLIEEYTDGSQLRAFDVHRRDPFLRWVLSLAGDARIEAPDDLAAAFHEMALRIAALHAPAPDG